VATEGALGLRQSLSRWLYKRLPTGVHRPPRGVLAAPSSEATCVLGTAWTVLWMELSEHAAVSAEAAAFRAKMREAGRALTGPGVDHAAMYESAAPAPAPESPHKMRAAGSDRFSINGGVEGATPKQKKHYDSASHMRSDHVDAAFKVRLRDGATPAAAVCSLLRLSALRAVLLATMRCS
jgi:hypothetical protein